MRSGRMPVSFCPEEGATLRRSVVLWTLSPERQTRKGRSSKGADLSRALYKEHRERPLGRLLLGAGDAGRERVAGGRFGNRARKELGNAAVATVVHMQLVGRKEFVVGDFRHLPPIAHHGEALEQGHIFFL